MKGPMSSSFERQADEKKTAYTTYTGTTLQRRSLLLQMLQYVMSTKNLDPCNGRKPGHVR